MAQTCNTGAKAIQLTTNIPIVHFWLHHTAHCAEKIVSVRCMGCASAERVGQGEVGGVIQRVMLHMVAARLCFERAMVGTGWATPCPDCMARLREHHSHLVGG